jgi:hypothetical protein
VAADAGATEATWDGAAPGAASGAELMVLRRIGVITAGARSMLPVLRGSFCPFDPNGLENGFSDRRIVSALQAAAMPPTTPTKANRDTARINSPMGP